MSSPYRHDSRAGNVGDVHKHICILSVLDAVVATAAAQLGSGSPDPSTSGSGSGPSTSGSGVLYVETHSGSGHYERTSDKAEESGVGRVLAAPTLTAPEIRAYAESVRSYRASNGGDDYDDTGQSGNGKRRYPGSPLLAVRRLGHPQHDRVVLAEVQPDVAEELQRSLDGSVDARDGSDIDVRVEVGDGYDVLRRSLVPPAADAATSDDGNDDDHVTPDQPPVPAPAPAAAVVLIDPPYDASAELDLAAEAAVDCVRRCSSIDGAGPRRTEVVVVIWYPLKDGRDGDLIRPWREGLVRAVAESSSSGGTSSTGDGGDGDDGDDGRRSNDRPPRRGRVLFGEVWTKGRRRGDGSSATVEGGSGRSAGGTGSGTEGTPRTTLVGAGVAIVNPPDGMEERIREWTSELHGILDPEGLGSWSTVLM